ncbi:MAG: hypothetical protein QOI57_2849 [Rubrobacteraceae bacterium]|jgi:hypothetical protein|nr:hypothetical protein [Rubrobacteraceae bacterium]
MPLRCGELFSRFGSCSRSFLGIISDKKNAFSPYLGTLSAITQRFRLCRGKEGEGLRQKETAPLSAHRGTVRLL